VERSGVAVAIAGAVVSAVVGSGLAFRTDEVDVGATTPEQAAIAAAAIRIVAIRRRISSPLCGAPITGRILM